jgi:hypothetical protein
MSPSPLAPISWIPVSEHTLGAQPVWSAVGSPGHFYLVVSPSDPYAVFLGGPVQLLADGVVSTNSGSPSGWAILWNNLSSSNSEPHADQRSMAFLSDGTILATSDGGIYALPAYGNQHWVDLNENLQNTEFFQVAYDSVDGLIVGGAQDNGTPIQNSPGITTYDTIIAPYVSTIIGNFGTNYVGSGDGGSVAVDNNGSQATIYLFCDGRLKWYVYTSNESSGDTGQLPISGLTPEDQNQYRSTLGNDASYPIASNEDGVGGILLGMTSLYLFDPANASLFNPNGITVLSTTSMTGKVTALTGVSASGAAYSGTSTSQLFMSTGGLGPFDLIPSPQAWYPGGKPNGTFARQVVGDPNDPKTVYVLDSNGQVWGNLKVGYDPWINLTGNLGGLTNNPTSMQIYDPTPYTGYSVLLVGALGGVYQTNVNLTGVVTSPAHSWSLYGEGLPNVQ